MTDPFDKPTVRRVRAELQSALDASPVDGLSVVVGRARYEDDAITFTVEVVREGAGDRYARDYKALLPRLDLAGAPLGTIFEYRGVRYRIAGWNDRGRKYPLIVEEVTPSGGGRRRKMELRESVRLAIHAAVGAAGDGDAGGRHSQYMNGPGWPGTTGDEAAERLIAQSEGRP